METIYYQDGALMCRPLREEDVVQKVAAYEVLGWHTAKEPEMCRIRDMEDGKCIAIAALWHGVFAGYVNLYVRAVDGPWKGKLPEVVDLGVLPEYQNRGIGGHLMDVVEELAAEQSDQICLAVGLHNGYGAAQRMYALRSYVPDGSGVWYQDQIWDQYRPCCNDDDLVLHLSKPVRRTKEASI